MLRKSLYKKICFTNEENKFADKIKIIPSSGRDLSKTTNIKNKFNPIFTAIATVWIIANFAAFSSERSFAIGNAETASIHTIAPKRMINIGKSENFKRLAMSWLKPIKNRKNNMFIPITVKKLFSKPQNL